MSRPQVRVRLSPEGIRDVIAALRQVENEARRTQRRSADGVGVLTSALRELKSLIPTIGFAGVVAGFLAMTRQAVQTADATGKLQQSVGGTVEELSGLSLAFRTNESSHEGLRSALDRTITTMRQLRSGSLEARDALRSIGVDADEVVGQSTPRALETIAQRLAAIEDPSKRAAAAQKVFGKSATDLLPALIAVGEQGIEPFIEKARRLGVLIDDEFADAAARANDALTNIRIQAEGLATQFASGLAPAVADAMETFSTAVTGDGFNAFRTFGEFVGGLLRGLVTLFVAVGKVFGAGFAQLATGAIGLGAAIKRVVQGDFRGAGEELSRTAREMHQIGVALDEDLRKLESDFFDGPNRNQQQRPEGAGGAGVVDPEEIRRVAAATRAARQQAAQDELRILTEKIKSEEQALKASYDQQLISLEEFFARRRELIERQNQVEVESLRLQRRALVEELSASVDEGGPKDEADRIKLRQQIAQVDAQIQQRQIVGARELAALDAERIQAQRALADQLRDSNAELLELEGRRHEAFQLNLEAGIQQLRELGARAGQTADEIDSNVRRLVQARTAAFNFEEVRRQGEQALAAFQRDAEQVRRDQEAGIISQLEGERRLIELERERLELLRQLAERMQEAAEATGNEDLIERARQFADSVNEIALSFQSATDFGAQFRSGALDSFQEGITSLLSNAQELESVEDAFRSLALTVAQSLQRMAAEILAKQFIFSLLRAFGGGGGGFLGQLAGSLNGGFKGGLIRGYNAGGDVRGPRLPIPGPDKIPLLGQEGEFILRRARVQEPGALDFLRAWNEGRISFAQLMRVPRFAQGGEVGAAAGTPMPGAAGGNNAMLERLRIVNVVDPELINEALASPSGEQTFLNVIRRNGTEIRRVLGL